MPVVEERVDRLERIVEEFVTSVGVEFNKLYNSQMRTEDLVAPGIPRIVKEAFGLEVIDVMIRRKKKLADGRTKEYDAIAVAGEYVFVDSTKNTLDSDGVKEFMKDIQEFRAFFPEYAKKLKA